MMFPELSPFWMKASWYKKHGYRKADRQGIAVLLWNPFAEDARAPRWFHQKGKLPELVQGKVNVTMFINSWCMARNLVAERAKRAAVEFPDQVIYREIDVSEHDAVAKWGRSEELFVDGKQVGTGPPPSNEKIWSIIAKRVGRLR